jgi:tripartite-type tricarboxylate transporter receptor subunit TctC
VKPAHRLPWRRLGHRDRSRASGRQHAVSTRAAHLPSLKAVAVSSEKRLPEFPDLPTLVELGYPELITTTWYSLSGPAGLPRDIVNKLNAAVNKAMTLPEVRKHLETEMVQTKAMTPDEFTAYMQRQVALWAPTARRIVEAK